jgi:Predicted membrane protein (DUF2142)
MRARWRSIPRAGRACALVALLNAVVWGLLIPPFQTPDELSHVGYVTYFAQTAKLPKVTTAPDFSPQENAVIDAVQFWNVIGQPRNRPPLTDAENAGLRAAERRHLDGLGSGNASVASGNPPLYYALESIPYWISPSHRLLDRMVLMRLLSALMAAGTVLAVFEFLRMLLPSTPWAWTVGALALAFQPTFGFMSGGVSNDNLLWLMSALTFLLIARCFRYGLTRWRAAALGLASAGALLSKAAFLGIVPAVGLALVLLVARAARERRGEVTRAAGVAVLAGGVPVALYLALAHFVWERAPFNPGQISVTVGAHAHGTKSGALSYAWQLFLPRLPFMNDWFGGNPLRQIWFNGFTGRFGWVDYGFPNWVYNLAWPIAIAIVVLAGIGLARSFRSLRSRWAELACYVTAVAGELALIGLVDYQSHITGQAPFEQARYLLPLGALYAAVIALAARAGGRRFGPALGAALVMLTIALSVFGQLITLTRYYG